MGNALIVPNDRLKQMRRIKTHLVRDDLIIARKAKTLENKAIQQKIEEETKQSLARIDRVVNDQFTTTTKDDDKKDNKVMGKDGKENTISFTVGKDTNSENGDNDITDDDPPITNTTKVAT